MKRTLIAIALLSAGNAHAADWTKWRRVAQVASCAASMIDAGTTVGKPELNPLIGSSAKPVSNARVFSLKIGLCAAPFILSEWNHRKYPGSTSSDKISFGFGLAGAGLYSGLAVRNAGIK